jgi:hypothetical protein
VKSIIFLESCLVLATYRNSLSKIWRILTLFFSKYGEFLYVFPKNPLHKIRTGFSFGRQSAKTRQKEKHSCQQTPACTNSQKPKLS